MTEEEQAQLQEQARKYGWRPQEEYTLDPEGWVDAEKFMDFPSTQVKILRDENKSLMEGWESDKSRFATDIEDIRRSTQDAVQAVLRQQEQSHEDKIAQVRQDMRNAALEGDTDAFDRYAAQEDELRKQVQPEPAQQQPQMSSAAQKYVSENDWTKDPFMVKQAFDAVEAFPEIKNKPDIEQYQWAESKLKEYFPHKFQEAAPKQSKVDPGGLGGGGDSRSALPKEAEDAWKTLKDMKVGDKPLYESKEEYAKSYWAQDTDK